MPRKTKELEENKTNTNIKKETKQVKKVASAKKSSTKAKVEASNKKEKTVAKKTAAKKDATKKSVTKKTATKKVTTKKSSSKKVTTKKSSKKDNIKTANIVEYYDLPYRYNQTVVKVLAQTPTTLFIYWDISDEDREKYKKEYGENFFETTKPVLKIYNDTLNYNFEVEINDFANSWYLHVNDSKCDYRVELGRRPIIYNKEKHVDYVYISSSNEIESPNDRILFDKTQNMVYFKNVKTNSKTTKSVANISFIRNMGKIYNIYDLYKQIYKDEDIENISNPSSGKF